MKIKAILKVLPLTGLLALAMTASPAMADKGDRDGVKRYSSQQVERQARHERREHRRHDIERRHQQRGHAHNESYREYAYNYPRGHKYAFRHGHKKHHRHRGHAYGHHHAHGYNQHRHPVVYETHRPRVLLDDLRFMIGLHTDNVDLIFRD